MRVGGQTPRSSQAQFYRTLECSRWIRRLRREVEVNQSVRFLGNRGFGEEAPTIRNRFKFPGSRLYIHRVGVDEVRRSELVSSPVR